MGQVHRANVQFSLLRSRITEPGGTWHAGLVGFVPRQAPRAPELELSVTLEQGHRGDCPTRPAFTPLDHELERKTSRRTRQQATYEIALGKRPSPGGSLVVMQMRPPVRRRCPGANLGTARDPLYEPILPKALPHAAGRHARKRLRYGDLLQAPGCR